MKDLPNVSAFKIEKELNNCQERFMESNNIKSKNVNVIAKINNIFASNNHVYKSRVKIYFNNDIVERTIVGKTNLYLLTLTGDRINIHDIIDIEKL